MRMTVRASLTLAKRRWGCFSSMRLTASSSSAGTSGRTSRRLWGYSKRCWVSTTAGSSNSLSGWRPASSS